MPANIDPLFAKAGDVSTDGTTGMSQGITAAANDYTGIDADVQLVFTAGPNGGFVERLRFKSKGTNQLGVARIYLNNGSTHTTAANNTLYGEFSLWVATVSAVFATPDGDYPMDVGLPAGFRVYVGLGVTAAAGWTVSAIGYQY